MTSMPALAAFVASCRTSAPASRTSERTISVTWFRISWSIRETGRSPDFQEACMSSRFSNKKSLMFDLSFMCPLYASRIAFGSTLAPGTSQQKPDGQCGDQRLRWITATNIHDVFSHLREIVISQIRSGGFHAVRDFVRQVNRLGSSGSAFGVVMYRRCEPLQVVGFAFALLIHFLGHRFRHLICFVFYFGCHIQHPVLHVIKAGIFRCERFVIEALHWITAHFKFLLLVMNSVFRRPIPSRGAHILQPARCLG